MSAHLDSAALAFGAILRARDPEHVWTTWVEGDGEQTPDTTTAGQSESSTVAQQQGPLRDRDGVSGSDLANDDRSKKAA